jgi:osmoprotectant transport system substrate-binding protein
MSDKVKAVGVLFAIVAAGIVLLAGAMATVDRIAGDHDRVVMGSKAFTESIILSEIASQWLEEGGVPVERRFNLGATNICFEALHSGAIDLYPEYTGTGLMAILHHPVVEDPAEALATVRTAFQKDYDLEWLDPLGFDNNYALAVPEKLSQDLGITKISDLLRHTNLRAGFASEFLARDDGWPGLEQKYDLHFDKAPGSMEAGLMYRAAASGQIDVISAYSTDGRIKTQNLKVLDDDRHFFPPYQAVFVARRSMLRKDPRVPALLGELAGVIHDDAMRSMNADVDFGSRSAPDVAREFLATVRPKLLTAREAHPAP